MADRIILFTCVFLFVAPPLFLVSPLEEVLVIEGELVTLNCTAEGHPLPAIAWVITTTNGMVSPVDTDLDLSNFTRFTQASVLSFIATEMDPLRANGTIMYCVAYLWRIRSGVESNHTLVTIAGECFTLS